MSRRKLRGFSVDRLVEARTDKGLSRGELARLAGLTTTTVQAWETGRSTPSVETLSSVADILGVDRQHLVPIEPDERYLGDLRVICAGYSQQELAALAGISKALLSSLELGQSRLADDTAAKIAHHLGVPVHTVIDAYARTRNRPPHTAP